VAWLCWLLPRAVKQNNPQDMNMKKLLQLCFVAALAIGAQSAHATLIDNSQALDMSAALNAGGSFEFSRTVLTGAGDLGLGNNYFSDRYSFTLDTPAQAGAFMTSVLYKNGTGLQITGFNLRQANGAAVFAGELVDVDQSWALGGLDALASGSYFLEVNGYATAAKASYSGTLAIAAVPEPSSLALMLAGMGVLGVMVRRRA
jgi:hypothetical protein